ncbi:hypothetical protein GCM10027038_38810 [Arthrobacter bambusae]
MQTQSIVWLGRDCLQSRACRAAPEIALADGAHVSMSPAPESPHKLAWGDTRLVNYWGSAQSKMTPVESFEYRAEVIGVVFEPSMITQAR